VIVRGMNVDRRWAALIAGILLVALFALGARDVGQAFPGFFFAADYRIFPVEPTFRARASRSATASSPPTAARRSA